MEWKNIPDEEFSILVKPTVTQPVTFAKVSADGYISLSCKIAEKFGKKPVQIRLNRDCTAIQIAQAEGENCVIFPKNGRKRMPEVVRILGEHKVPLPAVYAGGFCDYQLKWRGVGQENPTGRQSPITRATKKK